MARLDAMALTRLEGASDPSLMHKGRAYCAPNMVTRAKAWIRTGIRNITRERKKQNPEFGAETMKAKNE